MHPLLILLLLPAVALAAPWDALRQRSVSRTRQFVVYAADENARAAIAMDAEDVKEKFLRLLETGDTWKNPIIIEVNPQNSADPNHQASTVDIVNTAEGFKIDINVVLGADPREAHFPQQLVRALLLEYAYRTQPALIASGRMYSEPPSWLVEGFASLAADPDPDANAGLFRSLIMSGKTPSIATFLSEKPDTLDGPSRGLYSACSMSMVRLLLSLPNGQELMRNFIRHWPGPNSDPEAELLKSYPALNTGSQSLEKWWTVGLASLSAGDRYQGLSLEETNEELDGLLKFDVATDKGGKAMKSFSLDQYAEYQKLPGAKAALNGVAIRLLALEAQCSPLLREVVTAYQQTADQLAHKQDAHLKEHMADLAQYRTKLTGHMNQITDYLNWFEATQSTHESGSFDEYIRTANQPAPVAPRTDPITTYMDSVEQAMSQ